MMGQTHAFTGASAALVVAQGQTMGIVVASGAVGALAGLLPDLDHPNSHASQALGPLRYVGSRAIAWVFGGHRMGTHSVAVSVALGAAMAAFAETWLAVAVVVGYFVGGIVPDTMTRKGCGLLWPLSRRTYGLRLGTTGSKVEAVWWVLTFVITSSLLWLIS